MTPLEQHVCDQLDRLWPTSQLRGVIAVSGGSDSLGLMVLAQRWAGMRGVTLTVATVDHQLRAESREEAQFVAQMAARYGLGHHILQWDDPKDHGNLMAQAREARYALLARHAKGGPVLLGHSLDDQAETFLLRLARGSGVDGLSGMSERKRLATPCGDVMLLRPLLGVTRAQLQDHLRALGHSWVSDPSNEQAKYDRIKMRQAMPLLESLGLSPERLAQTARVMAASKEALSLRMQEAASHCVFEDIAPDVIVDPLALAQWDQDTQLRLLGQMIRYVSGAPYAPALSSLEQAMEHVHSGRSFAVGGVLLWQNPQAAQRRVLCCREPARMCDKFPRKAGEVWDRRWRLIRDLPEGVTLGTLTLQEAKAAAFLQDWPAPLRQTRPVVLDNDGSIQPAAPPHSGEPMLVPIRPSLKEFLRGD